MDLTGQSCGESISCFVQFVERGMAKPNEFNSPRGPRARAFGVNPESNRIEALCGATQTLTRWKEGSHRVLGRALSFRNEDNEGFRQKFFNSFVQGQEKLVFFLHSC